MKKILIVGGLGFIGSNLARLCVNKGLDVTILSRTEKKIDNITEIKDKVKLIIKDLKEVDREVTGFDTIYNLAGSTDNYAIIDDEPYKDIDMNCISTIALLEACKKNNPKARIVFGSTFFVNGRVKKLPVTPETPCKPLGLYGATRLAAEHFCHVYNNMFDMNIVIVRFTNVFGIYEQSQNKKKAGFNYLINLAVKGKEIKLYDNGNFLRDYIYVTDAANACIIIAEKGKKDLVYYIGNGKKVRFKELIDVIVKETGVKVKPVTPPDFHKKVGIVDFYCDNSMLKELGWNQEISFEQGIKETIEYYKKIEKIE